MLNERRAALRGRVSAPLTAADIEQERQFGAVVDATHSRVLPLIAALDGEYDAADAEGIVLGVLVQQAARHWPLAEVRCTSIDDFEWGAEEARRALYGDAHVPQDEDEPDADVTTPCAAARTEAERANA